MELRHEGEPSNSYAMQGGRALVRALEAFGIPRVYCLAGESFLPVIAALEQSASIHTVTARVEIEAGFSAMAEAALTSRPGVVMVTRGPGACNTSIALHTAQQSSLPLVLFVGQVPTRMMGYEATQYVDYARMFGTLCKRVYTPRTVGELYAAATEALVLAQSGRPGPVVVDMPVDILNAEGMIGVPRLSITFPHTPSLTQVGKVTEMIRAAERPLLVAGEALAFERAYTELGLFALQSHVAVATTFRQQDMIAFNHPSNIGNLGLSHAPHVQRAWNEADLIIVAGHRMNQETTRGFSADLMKGKKLVMIHPDEPTLHHPLYPADVSLHSHIRPALQLLNDALNATVSDARKNWISALHNEQLAFMKSPIGKSVGEVDMAEVMRVFTATVPEESIVITDAGNFATWVQTMHTYPKPGTQLGPINGAMGFGVPAAIAACLARPDVPAFAFVGDGGFMMTGPAALATAIHENLPVKVIVSDNSFYGTIFMHHLRSGKKGKHALALSNPDIAALARSFEGVAAFTVSKTAEFEAALKGALAHHGPALIHLKTDIRDIAAGMQARDLVPDFN